LSRIAAGGIDRLAFGTDAAAALYARTVPAAHDAVSTVIPALPAACRCGRGSGTAEPKEPGLVLFLGALTGRKGFDRLLAAWPSLAGPADGDDGEPAVRLQIVGKGPFEQSATELAARDSRVTVTIDPPRAQVHAELRRARVLVLLSQPTPGWREQVGLPLVEGLAHGCAVVTTTETGLAGWLSAHGHQVLSPDADAAAVAAAIRRAVTDSPTPAQITASLPALDGRLAADAWLFGDDPDMRGPEMPEMQIREGQDRRNGRSGSDTDDSAE
jgi:glycosyltransferase involved in cell wall biosynthesis